MVFSKICIVQHTQTCSMKKREQHLGFFYLSIYFHRSLMQISQLMALRSTSIDLCFEYVSSDFCPFFIFFFKWVKC